MSEDEAIEKLKELVTRCKECKFATCENCEINWNEVQAIETILDLYKNTKYELKGKESLVDTMSHNEEVLIRNYEILENKLKEEREKNKELINGQIDFWLDDKEIIERIKTNYISKEKIKTLKENFNKKQSSFMYRSK